MPYIPQQTSTNLHFLGINTFLYTHNLYCSIIRVYLILYISLSHAAPLDYISVNEQLVFDSGVNRVCFDVATTSDSVPEIMESFRVALISTSDGRVRIGSPDSAVVQITDEDG